MAGTGLARATLGRGQHLASFLSTSRGHSSREGKEAPTADLSGVLLKGLCPSHASWSLSGRRTIELTSVRLFYPLS